MRPATLTYVNLFVRDLGTLPDFYARLFGFTEIPEMRNPVFRGFDTGASSIGFMAPEVYGVLELQEHRADSGVRGLLNIDVTDTAEVDRLTDVAVEMGAELVKKPATTSYGWYQSVLLDPERNVFRINTVLAP
jgi:predicted enzyme related to lactoylglutathione lyase